MQASMLVAQSYTPFVAMNPQRNPTKGESKLVSNVDANVHMCTPSMRAPAITPIRSTLIRTRPQSLQHPEKDRARQQQRPAVPAMPSTRNPKIATKLEGKTCAFAATSPHGAPKEVHTMTETSAKACRAAKSKRHAVVAERGLHDSQQHRLPAAGVYDPEKPSNEVGSWWRGGVGCGCRRNPSVSAM